MPIELDEELRARVAAIEGKDWTGTTPHHRGRAVTAVLAAARAPLTVRELEELLEPVRYVNTSGVAEPIRAVRQHLRWLMGFRDGDAAGRPPSGPVHVERSAEGRYALTAASRAQMEAAFAGEAPTAEGRPGNITEAMIRAAYDAARRVSRDELSPRDAVAELRDGHGFNPTSANDYVNVFRHMIVGKVYKRDIRDTATDYYLTTIRQDYGDRAHSLACDAFEAHLDYYERLPKHHTQHARRELLARHRAARHGTQQADLARREAELAAAGEFTPAGDHDARERVLAAVVRRRGQSEFRRRLLQRFGGRCAISGCPAEPALEAAHIDPYRGDHTDVPENGLLLRADLHTLFDLGLIAVDPAGAVLVSPALDGSDYADYRGRPLRSAADGSAGPDPEALARHRRRAGL